MEKYFVIRYFRGTCSSVEMLKGYLLIFRNAEGVHGQRKVGNPSLWGYMYPRLGTPALNERFQCFELLVHNIFVFFWCDKFFVREKVIYYNMSNKNERARLIIYIQ